MIRSGIRPTVSINKPDSMEANNWTKPTATAPPKERKKKTHKNQPKFIFHSVAVKCSNFFLFLPCGLIPANV